MLTRGSGGSCHHARKCRRQRSLPRLTVLVVGAVTTTLMARPADAWADGWGTIDCAQAPTPQCQLQVGEDASSPAPPGTSQANEPQAGGGGGSAGADNLANCGYRPSAYEAPAGAVGSGLLPSAAWYEGLCSTTGVITNPVQVPSLTPADVARLARGQLGLPRPDLAASPATTQLVNLPTWLWLDSGWNDVTTTASVPGVSVTARAHPRSVTWSMGDGATVTCDGAGTPFRQSTDPRSASPDCGYTYRRSSAGQPAGAFAVSATVHWSIRWSGAGQSGTFPNLTTTSSTRFEVAESQALNVRPER